MDGRALGYFEPGTDGRPAKGARTKLAEALTTTTAATAEMWFNKHVLY